MGRLRDALEWWAYRSRWGRFIHWADYWLMHGETRTQAVQRDLALAERLDAAGYSAEAESLRERHDLSRGCPLCRDGDLDIRRYHDCDSAVGR